MFNMLSPFFQKFCLRLIYITIKLDLGFKTSRQLLVFPGVLFNRPESFVHAYPLVGDFFQGAGFIQTGFTKKRRTQGRGFGDRKLSDF